MHATCKIHLITKGCCSVTGSRRTVSQMKKNRMLSSHPRSKESFSVPEKEYIPISFSFAPNSIWNIPVDVHYYHYYNFCPQVTSVSVLHRRPIKNFPSKLDSSGVSQHKQKASVWPKSPRPVLTMEVMLKVNKCTRN